MFRDWFKLKTLNHCSCILPYTTTTTTSDNDNDSDSDSDSDTRIKVLVNVHELIAEIMDIGAGLITAVKINK